MPKPYPTRLRLLKSAREAGLAVVGDDKSGVSITGAKGIVSFEGDKVIVDGKEAELADAVEFLGVSL